MRRIILFDTSIATQNKGDEIIMESVCRELKDILHGEFVHTFPTHLVSFPFLHNFTSAKAKLARVANQKFICGTNLFWTNMIRPNPLLNINLANSRPYKGSVLFGVGYDKEHCKRGFDPYSKMLWKRILSKDFVHSTRDDKTVQYIESLGLKAINTGCPTLWMLTPEHCSQIPKEKADSVVFTLSSVVGSDYENDQRLIEMLLDNYKNVYFWSQTFGGFKTLKTFKNIEHIKYVDPDLNAYRSFLNNNCVDYVGTRLHGGVFAMQQKKRTIILSVDHRAVEFNKYNINCESQYDLDGIEKKINSNFETRVKLDYGVINKWLNQFISKKKRRLIEELKGLE